MLNFKTKGFQAKRFTDRPLYLLTTLLVSVAVAGTGSLLMTKALELIVNLGGVK